MKAIINHDLFIIAVVIGYFAICVSLSCHYNNIAFIGCGVIIAFIAGCIGAAIADNKSNN